jgi:hypothetical protein
LLLLYGLTAISTGFNAQYFCLPLGARSASRGATPRLAALVLALLHGALFLENAYFAIAFLLNGSLTVTLVRSRGCRCGPSSAASGGVTLLLLRSPSPANRRR